MMSLSAVDVEHALNGAYCDLKPLHSQGGQGFVFRACAADGEQVALKVYNPDQVEERNEREVGALRKLSGSTIVRLHNAGSIAVGTVVYRYLATTFVEGEPLSGMVARGPVPPRVCAQVAHDVALALDELWSLNIVHRDVKPDNIIVSPDGRAVLIDLGVARHLDQKTITSFGFTFGTAGYFAPEHIAGARVTCKADVFALGIVMQEMLIGRHPTHRNQHLLRSGGPKSRNIIVDVHPKLASIIDSMLGLEPIDRPSPARVAAALAQLLEEGVG